MTVHAFLTRAALPATAVLAVAVLPPAASADSLASPPSNGRIVAAVDTGLAFMNPDGSGQWGAADLLPGDRAPAWSPDGTRLAVVTHWRDLQGIRLTRPDGRTVGMLTTDSGDDEPAWSSDGRRVAFVNGGQIHIVDADGAGRAQVTFDLGWKSHPSWSPDGRRLAFSAWRFDGSGADVWTLEFATGAVSRLTTNPAPDERPAWSPDGAEIAFVSARDGAPQLWVIRPDGTNERRLTASSSDWPAWAPDGSRIAFLRGGSIWTMARGGGDERRLTSEPRSSWTAPAWQPIVPGPASCTITGTRAADLLVGSDDDDVICGLGGDDTIVGLGGDDVLRGGDGHDWIAGGLGRDELAGGNGPDRLDAVDGGPDWIGGGGNAGDFALVDGRRDILRGVRVSRVSRNLAAWRPTTASSSTITNPPARAVDGRIDDWWNSGAAPAQWVEVDLGRPTAIGRIRLVAGQQGSSDLVVLGRGPRTAGAYRLLRRYSGPTASRQEIVFRPARPWRDVRFVRVLIGSPAGAPDWASLHELEVEPPR